jgi:hypothetical protein
MNHPRHPGYTLLAILLLRPIKRPTKRLLAM